MLTFWRARTKDFGSHPIWLNGSRDTITASATVRAGIGGISDKDDTSVAAGHTGYIDEAFVASIDVAAGSSTITVSILKYDASAGLSVTLVNAFDLKTLVSGKVERVPFVALTDAQRVMDFGDFLYADVAAAGTVTQQPNGLSFAVKVKLLT